MLIVCSILIAGYYVATLIQYFYDIDLGDTPIGTNFKSKPAYKYNGYEDERFKRQNANKSTEGPFKYKYSTYR